MTQTREQYNAYMAEYMRRRIAERRGKAIVQLGGKCAICGSTEELEFDHVNRDPDPRSRKGHGTMWTFSEARLQKELEKCQLLCKLHHLEKTRKENSVEHGGGLSGKKNCPCVLCKQRKAEYMASYVRKGR